MIISTTQTRPTDDSIEVIGQVVEHLSKKVSEWIGEKSPDIEEIKFDISRLLEIKDLDLDGYRLARHLEKFGYEPDLNLAFILDDTEAIFNTYLEIETSKWIKNNNIKPKFNIGDKVKVQNKSRRYTGEIIDIDPRLGLYHVFVQALKHTKKGDGVKGILMFFETVDLSN